MSAALMLALVLSLPRYTHTVWLEPDGSAQVDIDVDLPAGTVGTLRLPAGDAALTGVTSEGVSGAIVTLVANGQRSLWIEIPRALTAQATLHVTGHAHAFLPALMSAPKAFGNRTMRYRFVNSSPSVFGSVVSRVFLPDGYAVTSVDDSEPPATESSTTPPFAIVSAGGRNGVSITATEVGLGGVTSLVFRFKERRISPWLPIALVALGALYLVLFRALLRAPGAPQVTS